MKFAISFSLPLVANLRSFSISFFEDSGFSQMYLKSSSKICGCGPKKMLRIGGAFFFGLN